nr:MAG TPA: hypothetical protein [Bacteriophage sp.]
MLYLLMETLFSITRCSCLLLEINLVKVVISLVR